MPFGTVPNGTSNRIFVGAAAGSATVPLGGLQGWEYGGQADTSVEDFYNAFASITTVGELTRSGTATGKWAVADSGLDICFAASETQDIISFAVAPGGTDGQGIPVRVSEFRLTGGGVNQAADYRITFVQAADPFDLGSGL